MWKIAPHRRDAQDTVRLPEGGRDQIQLWLPARSMGLSRISRRRFPVDHKILSRGNAVLK
jgi:hypothetical protein